MLIPQIAESLAHVAKPWASLFSDSKGVSAAVLFFHLAPLVTAAGTAFAADQTTLRVFRDTPDERSRHLAALARTHGFVVGGLAVSIISGILLFLSDVETFWASPVFWIKLFLVLLLLVNGGLILRTEKALGNSPDTSALWSRLRRLSIASGVLWLGTTLVGVLLASYA